MGLNNLTEKEMKDYYESDIVGDIRASHILVSFNYDDDDTDDDLRDLVIVDEGYEDESDL